MTKADGSTATFTQKDTTYGTTATALGSSASAGSVNSASRSDHVHPFPALTSCTGTLSIAKGGTGKTTKEEAFTNLIHQGNTTDANTALKRGIYTYSTNCINVPETNKYGAIETIIANDIAEGTAIGGQTATSWVWQWGYRTDTVNPYIRNSINASAFSDWRKVLLEGDSGSTLTNLNASNISSGTLNSARLPTSGVTAATYGPTANASPSNGGTIKVPKIVVDNKGRITSASDITITLPSYNLGAYLPLTGGTLTGNLTVQANITATGNITGNKVYGAVWNDYAEYRETVETIEAGRVVVENGDDTLSLANKRLMPGANVVSDTFGFAIGKTEKAKTPIAISGRALVYTNEDRKSYKPGDPVCSGPNGTVSKMTRKEAMQYPDRIIGTVSAIPEYETWGTDEVPVNGRIWIRIS